MADWHFARARSNGGGTDLDLTVTSGGLSSALLLPYGVCWWHARGLLGT